MSRLRLSLPKTTSYDLPTVAVVLGFAILYNVGAVTVALAGAMNPLLAVILMPASALVSMALALGGTQLRSGGRRERRSFPAVAGVPRSAQFPKPVRNDGARRVQAWAPEDGNAAAARRP